MLRKKILNRIRLIKWRDKSLKISLRKDRAIFLICTVFALIFWFFVKLSKDYKSTYELDVHFILPADQALVEKPPEHITAVFKAGAGICSLSQ